MTGDLELYLRGLYRNRWPHPHRYIYNARALIYECECGAFITRLEMAMRIVRI